MNDFLKENYNLITHLVEFLAAFTGLIVYKKYKSFPVKYFIWFLLFIAICDQLASYPRYVRSDKMLEFLIGTRIEKNFWFATLYWDIGSIMFYSFYYGKILKSKVFKSVIKYSSISFFVFSIFYIVLNFNAFFTEFHEPIIVFGAVIIMICTVFYFVETLKSDKVLTFYKSINFYISVTIFIWWLIITPIGFFDVYYVYDLGSQFRDQNFEILRKYIYLLSNVLMYLTFTFALIWCKQEND